LITRFTRGVKGIEQVKPGLESTKLSNNQKALEEKYTSKTYHNLALLYSANGVFELWSIGMMGLTDLIKVN
jgi:hypothetical protein